MDNKQQSITNAGRVARNTIANWAGNFSNLIVVLFLTPYVLHGLGDERFGVYLIAQQALCYISLMTLGMRSAVNRFICKDIAADNVAGLNATLSTISIFYLTVGILGMLICAGLGLVAPAFFNVKLAYAHETGVLFTMLGVCFLLSLLEYTFRGVLIGHQRFDLLNGGNILREFSRAVMVVILFSLGWKTLGSLATGIFAAYVLSVMYFWFISHRQQPGLRVSPSLAKRSVAREVFGFGVWNGVIQIGNVVTFATPPLIVAKLLGPEHVVFYVIPFMFADRLNILVESMSNTLTPIAASTLVTGDRAHFSALIVKGTRMAATLCLPIGAIFIVFCKPFLTLWMGPEYAWSWVVYGIAMIAMFGRITQTATVYTLIGGGHIRGFAYIQIVSAIAAIGLTIFLAGWTSFGVVGVAVGMTIPLFLSHTLALPWYASRQINLSLSQFYRQAYTGPVLSTFPGVAVALLTCWVWPPTGYVVFSSLFLLSLSASAVTAWFTCFD